MANAPPSPVARYFLRSLLDVVPVFTNLEPYRDLNMNVWRKNGAYSMIFADANKFILQVNQREYAANLVAEVNHLLNHAMEHRAHLINSLTTGDDPSPAWSFVSLYYFSLFIAMAWTRVANKGIFYLDKEAVTEYCGSLQKNPGAGAFCVTAIQDPATLAFHVTFKKCSRNHFHEAVWLGAANEAKEAAVWIEQLSSGRRATPEELVSLQAMKLFMGCKFNDPQTWPSVLRNSVNYRPGFGYRSVPRNNNLKIRARLTKTNWKNVAEVVMFGERAKQTLANTKEPFEAANDSVDLLIAQTLLLERFVEESIKHLCILQELPCSAMAQRAKFGRTYSNKLKSLLSPLEW